MLTLYHHNISACAQKVRIALAEKKLPHELRFVDLMKGEQVAPGYLKINPKGLVPALVHNGNPVGESTIIMEYLEDAFPDIPLRPAPPLQRARMRSWTQLPDATLHAACGILSFAAAFADQMKALFTREQLDARLAKVPDRQRAWRQEQLLTHGFAAPFVPDAVRLHDKLLKDIEENLAAKRWLAGDAFSLADCAISPYLWRLDQLGLSRWWRDLPRVSDWYARILARPSWAEAIVAFPSHAGDQDDDLKSRGIDVWPRVEKIIRAS